MAVRRAPEYVSVIRRQDLQKARLTLLAHRPLLRAALADLRLGQGQIDGVLACIEHVLDNDFRSSETRRAS